MSEELPVIKMYLGDTTKVRLALTDTDSTGQEIPIDLTGSTILVMAKRDLTDPDEEAVVDVSVSDHEDEVGGITVIAIDLSSVEDRTKALRLTGDIVLRDSQGEEETVGLFTLEADRRARHSSS